MKTEKTKNERLQDFFSALAQFEHNAYKGIASAAKESMRKALESYLSYSEDGNLVLIESQSLADQIYTRFASALTQWATRTDLDINFDDYLYLCKNKQSIASIFSASGYRGTAHLVDILSERQGEDGRSFQYEWLPALVGLSRLDDTPPELLEFTITQQSRIAVPAIIGWLCERQVLTQQGENNRTRLIQMSPVLINAKIPHSDVLAMLQSFSCAWMYCSYAVSGLRHNIKEGMNVFLRNHILEKWSGMDLPERPKRNRLRLLVINEFWSSGHAMYRCFAPLVENLKSEFELWGLTSKKNTDYAASQIFDCALTWEDCTFEDIVKQIHEITPDAIYFPSIGMSLTVILLANLRLAPVQFASLGHTGTHFLHDTIDFICEFGLKYEHQILFTERLLPVLAEPAYHPHPQLPEVLPEYTPTPDAPVRIGVHGKVMKLNHTLFDLINTARNQTNQPTEVHFFPGERGGQHDGLVNAIHLQIPDAIIHPPYTYPTLLQHLSKIDIFIQTWPFGSNNSMVDCLLLGKPYLARNDTDLLPKNFQHVLTELGLDVLLTHGEHETLSQLIKLIESADLRESIRLRLKQNNIKEMLFLKQGQLEGDEAAVHNISFEITNLLKRFTLSKSSQSHDFTFFVR